MATIRRLSDSCLLVTTDAGTTLLDPGFHTFDTDAVDLATIGDVQRVLITHRHGDHVKPEFVRWLIDRGEDVTVHGNDDVAALLAEHDIPAATTNPDGVTAEDVAHEMTPFDSQPPNRAFTVAGLLTHPGDSFQISASGPVLALPLMTPWCSMTEAMHFARRLAPQQAIPVHDFHASAFGREWTTGVARTVLAPAGIEVVPLDWGDSYTV